MVMPGVKLDHARAGKSSERDRLFSGVATGASPVLCGMKKAEGVFPSLPARNERGESWREGKQNGLLAPALSSFFGEEREKGSAAALQANYLPKTIGVSSAAQIVRRFASPKTRRSFRAA